MPCKGRARESAFYSETPPEESVFLLFPFVFFESFLLDFEDSDLGGPMGGHCCREGPQKVVGVSRMDTVVIGLL